MKWIKAFDDVPSITKYYLIRNWITGKDGASVYCDSQNSISDYCRHNKLDFPEIEWLDESPLQQQGYQQRVGEWMMKCFSMEICSDIQERNHRFLEESLELVQSLGCTKEEAYQLVDYVFNRPLGEPGQEVGGVMVTLAALCNPAEINLDAEAEKELHRISAPEIIEKIQNKQATKPKHSPLPQPLPPVPSDNNVNNLK